MELTYSSIAQVRKPKNHKTFWVFAGIVIAGFLMIKYFDNQNNNVED